jgi:hypothetical protein
MEENPASDSPVEGKNLADLACCEYNVVIRHGLYR